MTDERSRQDLRIGVAADHFLDSGSSAGFSASIAEMLSRSHRVTLLASERLDRVKLSGMLGVDLECTTSRLIPAGALEMARASADYDLFVGNGFGTPSFCRARFGLLAYCPPMAPKKSWLSTVSTRRRAKAPIEIPGSWTKGLHRESAIREVPTRWTNGDATLSFLGDESDSAVVELVFGRFQPKSAGTIRVRIESENGEPIDELRVRPLRHARDPDLFSVHRLFVPNVRRDPRIVLRLRSPTFVPSDLLATTDNRELGVALIRARVLSGGVATSAVDARSVAIATSYNRLLSPSSFMASQARSSFGTTAAVVRSVPAELSPGTGRGRRIVALGPMATTEGRSSHLELIDAFRSLTSSGESRQWSLAIVVDVPRASRSDLRELRAAASDLDVAVHTDLDLNAQLSLLDSASIVWVNIGTDNAPGAVGAVVLRAMARGLAPVVKSSVEATEVVLDGRSGHLFTSVHELVLRTADLIAQPAQLAAISRRAFARAESLEREEGRGLLDAIVDDSVEDRSPFGARRNPDGAAHAHASSFRSADSPSATRS